MGKGLKRHSFWLRRRSSIPFIIIASVVVLMLVLNEETSVKTNMEYDRRINSLKSEIKLNQDSARYYREHKMAIENGNAELEYLAREKYHFKRPSEDIFIYSDN